MKKTKFCGILDIAFLLACQIFFIIFFLALSGTISSFSNAAGGLIIFFVILYIAVLALFLIFLKDSVSKLTQAVFYCSWVLPIVLYGIIFLCLASTASDLKVISVIGDILIALFCLIAIIFMAKDIKKIEK